MTFITQCLLSQYPKPSIHHRQRWHKSNKWGIKALAENFPTKSMPPTWLRSLPLLQEGPRSIDNFHAGTIVLHEIHKYQKGTDILICKVSFQYLLSEITMDVRADVHWKSLVVQAMHEDAETYTVFIF